ncbi:MAG: hypothetical protein WD768_13465 [Phycisphaeraceae bacterium]
MLIRQDTGGHHNSGWSASTLPMYNPRTPFTQGDFMSEDRVTRRPIARQETVKAAVARFLFPFSVPALPMDSHCDQLRAMRTATGKEIWVLESNVSQTYQDNILPMVGPRLFSSKGTTGRYLTLRATAGNELFGKRELKTSAGTVLISLCPECKVELFLTERGVGVVSLTMVLSAMPGSQPKELTLAAVAEVVNMLHHGPKPGRPMSKLPQLRPCNPSPGATPQSLFELARSLVAPLSGGGPAAMIGDGADSSAEPLELLQSIRKSALVYVVLRLSHEVDLIAEANRKAAAELLLALQSARQVDHSLIQPNDTDSRIRLLTEHQLCAVGHDGVAHFVVDKPPPPDVVEHPYDMEQFHIAEQKHFFPYLLTLLQRYMIFHVTNEATRSLARVDSPQDGTVGQATETSHPDHAADLSEQELVELHRHLERDAFMWPQAHIQTSQVTQTFYRMCREALDIEESWHHLERVLSTIDARVQAGIANANLKTISHVQRKVEWVEVLLIAVYVMELSHLLADSFGLGHFQTIWQRAVFGISFGGVAIIALVLAFRALQPHKQLIMPRRYLVGIGVAVIAFLVIAALLALFSPALTPSH